jgi:hypothetical protein
MDQRLKSEVEGEDIDLWLMSMLEMPQTERAGQHGAAICQELQNPG